jgi:hypothetical protein
MILFSNFSPRLEVAYPSFPSSHAAEAARDTKRLVFLFIYPAQLSKNPRTGSPRHGEKFHPSKNFLAPQSLVGLTGLEPVTLRLSSACSNQLSYRPEPKSPVGIPKTPHAWRHGDSNPRPIACKATALPAELCPP